MNHRLETLSAEAMRCFCDCCPTLLEEIARDGVDRRTHLRSFRSGDRAWEVAITPLVPDGEAASAPERAVGCCTMSRRASACSTAWTMWMQRCATCWPGCQDRESAECGTLGLIEGKIVEGWSACSARASLKCACWIAPRRTGAGDFARHRAMPPGASCTPAPREWRLRALASCGEAHLCRDARDDPFFYPPGGGAQQHDGALLLHDRVVAC